MTDQPSPPLDPLPPTTTMMPPPPTSDNSWAATTSVICGAAAFVSSIGLCIPILGNCCCIFQPLLVLAGIIFGIIGFKSQKAMLAKIGIGLSIAAIIVFGLMVLLTIVFNVLPRKL